MEFELSPTELKLFTAIIIGSFSFMTYWFSFGKLLTPNQALIHPVKSFMLNKWGGVIILFFIPLLLLVLFLPDLSHYSLIHLLPGNTSAQLVPLLIASLIIIGLNFLNRKSSETQKFYPDLRINHWNKKWIAFYFFSWTVYLIAYEWLFRSLLFLSLIPVLGWAPAMAINAAFYSFAHLPKGPAETFASIPFSVVICLLCYSASSIWPGIALHLVLSYSGNFFLMKEKGIL